VALEGGDFSKAETLARDVLRRSPQNVDARRRLIQIYLKQGRVDEAIEQMRLTLELTPDDCQGYCDLAELMLQSQRTEEATRLIEMALRLEPAHLQLLLMKGTLLEASHDWSGAQEVYYRILEQDRENGEVLLRLARISLAQKQPEQALPLLRQLLALPDLNPEQHRAAEASLARAYSLANRWDQTAEVLSQQQGETGSPDPDLLYRLAYAHYRAGQWEKARSTLSELQKIAPNNESTVQLASHLQGIQPTEPAGSSVLPAGHVVPPPTGYEPPRN